MENKFFTSIPIMDGITAIAGRGGEFAYLVEGSERALLIDGLAGVGSLKSFVRDLTDKPVTIALTHGHIDHNGAAYEYGLCYVHPYDIPMLFPIQTQENTEGLNFSAHSSVEAKYNYVVNGRFFQGDAHGITMDDVVKPRPIITYPCYEGDIFDLGDVKIEVAEIPGHTQGSIVFIDRARRLAFFGDACNMNTLVGIPGSTSVEEYKTALEHFRDSYLDAIDVVYNGHTPEPADAKQLVSDGIRVAGQILDGTDAHVVSEHRGRVQILALPRGPRFAPEGSICNISYSEEKIHKQDHPHIITGNVPICER